MTKHQYLSFDLGASSGRGIIGTLENGRIGLREINRFRNGMTTINGSYFWDIFRLYDDIKQGLGETAAQGIIPDSVGIDTWGVDYGLLDQSGQLIGIPYAYRDPRTETAIADIAKEMPLRDIYARTGIQFMPFNTLLQLYSAQRQGNIALKNASHLLFIPDLLNYLLTGKMKTEFTFATTSQMYNPGTKDWDKDLIKLIGLSPSLLKEIAPPGTLLGNISEPIATETGLKGTPLALVASHDTGSAIAAIPAIDSHFAYISSGTWSLMGIETQKAIITDKSFEYNFTNEGGVENTFRVLKNIMGLWLIQECRRIWLNKKQEYSFAELVQLSDQCTPFRSLFNPDDMSLYNPVDMVVAIAELCKANDEPIPSSPGEFARSIYESLALKYRLTLDQLRNISDKTIKRIHIIGGGSQNETLCQYTANATGLPVIAGPAEGTALGNIVVQAISMGHIKNLSEARNIIRNSFDFKTFEPQDTKQWNDAYERFKLIIKN